MKKWMIAIGVFVLVSLGFYLYWLSRIGHQTATQLSVDGKVHFATKNLPDGVVAESGDFQVLSRQLDESPALVAFEKEKQKLLGNTSDGKDQVHLLELNTQIYRYKLKLIDQIIKKENLLKEAEKLGLTPEEYKRTYVYSKLPKGVSEADIERFMKKYQMADNPDQREMAREKLIDMRMRRGLDFVLEQYVLDLPIAIDVEKPNNPWSVDSPLIPRLGSDAAKLKVQFFGNTGAAKDRILLQKLLALAESSSEIQLLYRPVFSENDALQSFIAIAQSCLLQQDPSLFWIFLKQLAEESEISQQAQVIEIMTKQGVSKERTQQCFQNQGENEFLVFHLNFAKEKGIRVGPVVVVGGETYSGAVNSDDVEKAIGESLGWKTAGTW